MFYELYKNDFRDYRIARKSYKKLWENPEQQIYLNWSPALKGANIISDICYDNSGLLYIGQTKRGNWFMGKYSSDLFKEYWFTRLSDEHGDKACSFISIERIDDYYTVIGGKYYKFEYLGIDINKCTGGESIIIQTDLNGHITTYLDYDEFDKITTENDHEPNIFSAVTTKQHKHFILIHDYDTEVDGLYEIYMNYHNYR